ncbi:MAG: hypothetical protein WDA47_01350 [Bacilli bacterium]
MTLNIFDDIRDLIISLLEKFSWGSVAVLFAGVALGFVMCFFIYLVIVLSSLKKNEIAVHTSKIEIESEEVKRVIKSAVNRYVEESSNLPINQKIADIKDISWGLINDIAKMYYPDSAYPIYELSIDEFMELNHYITNRVDTLFKGRIMRTFKKIKVSQILKILDLKRKMDESKAVKVAKKAHVPGFFKATMSVLNVFNPGYWVKKLMINTTLSIGTNKIAKTVIDIVGEETSKVYSKSVFNKELLIDSDVEKTISELEKDLEKSG